MRRNELPISFLWRMTARDAPITPPSTVSFRRLRRALVRKICSLSSLTFFSRPRSRTLYAPASAPADGSPAGAPVGDGAAAVASADGAGDAPAAGAAAAE